MQLCNNYEKYDKIYLVKNNDDKTKTYYEVISCCFDYKLGHSSYYNIIAVNGKSSSSYIEYYLIHQSFSIYDETQSK